ncbi:DUF3116 family protein [Listeria monocytogenes]|uniref:DUF3116 family protein n=1 Tax=Listeria monocytogenes TaxID=1639 RepID=UPI001F104DA1|nr:DUF3116 family protein [Listeria monocytogenes]MCH5033858.1 DUF3116 family protein [Listeria monocytogenes]
MEKLSKEIMLQVLLTCESENATTWELSKMIIDVEGANRFTKSELLKAVYTLEYLGYVKRIKYGSSVRYTKTNEGVRFLDELKTQIKYNHNEDANIKQ